MADDKKSLIEIELENRIGIDAYFNKFIHPVKKGTNKISQENPRSCCPFHDEHDPSFAWWTKNKKFHCFGCGVSGNIVRLHQLKARRFDGKTISNTEAINELINMFQLWDLPEVVAKIEEDNDSSKIRQAQKGMIDTYQFGFSSDAITLAKYGKMQDTIMQYNDTDKRIRAFAELDMMTALAMSRVIDNN